MDNQNLYGIKWSKIKGGYWHSYKYGYQHVYVWEQEHQATVDKGDVIHHINGDKEDNRIENLQLMPDKEHRILHSTGNTNTLGKTYTEEQKNKLRLIHRAEGITQRNTSGFKGVSWNARDKNWRARIGGRTLGYFDNAEEAARAYDTKARELWGNIAYQNFPA